MDYISGTNKKVFLWIKGSSSFFLTIQNNGGEGPGSTFLPLPSHFQDREETPRPSTQLKLGLLSPEGWSAWESLKLWQIPSPSQKLWKGQARTFYATE